MTKEEQIKEGIKNIGGGNEKTFLAIVEKNYPDKDYIDVKDLSGTLYTEVRKRAGIGEPKKGFLITPTIGSSVIVSRLGESDELFVELFSDVDSIQFNGGKNEGLVKVVELTAKLNSLEKDLNDLKTKLYAWVPVPNDGGASLKTTLTTWFGKKLTETNKKDIQNDTFTH